MSYNNICAAPHAILKERKVWRKLRFHFSCRIACLFVSLALLVSACGSGTAGVSSRSLLLVPSVPSLERSSTTASAPNARPADAFVAALGVDTHFGYTNTVYKYLTSPAPSGNSIVSALKALGIRHIRDGSIELEQTLCPAYRIVIGNGTDVDAITSLTTDVSGLKRIVTCLGAGLFAIEGPNELDLSGNPNWAQADVNEMQLLHANRGSAFPAAVKLFSPSATSEAAYIALAAVNGDSLKNDVDDANAHIYFSAREPETKGWGGTDRYGTYGALTTTRNWAQIPSPGKAWVTTETGYPDSATDAGYISPTVKAKYLTRDVLQHWQDGAQCIYTYELAQENGSWGLMDENLYPKPAYTALRNLIAILTDPGPAISSSYFQYGVSANPDVAHVLFKKRDGSFWLCVWQDDEGWNPNSNQPININPTAATITFGAVPALLKRYQINPSDGSVTQTSIKPAASITTTVTDSPAIIQINATSKNPVISSAQP